jgi:hypothetical protein
MVLVLALNALILVFSLQMLPPGDWHCPNCSCKFCGVASDKNFHRDDTTVSKLLTCSLCVKKCILPFLLWIDIHLFICISLFFFLLTLTFHFYVDHKSCMQEINTLSIDTNNSVASFCGKKCREVMFQGFA